MCDKRTYLPNSTFCFVCGEDNPAGLQTRFYIEGDVVKADLKARNHHCGYIDIVHGGVVAALMDETMGWAATRAVKRMCYTGDMTVRYLKPIPLDRDVTACGRATRVNKRMCQAEGWIEDSDGTVYVKGEGRFMPFNEEETLKVDDMLLYRDGDERLFEELRRPAGPE